jgi:hypothetical protein
LAGEVISDKPNFERFDERVKSLFPGGKVSELTIDALAEVLARRIDAAKFVAIVSIGKQLTWTCTCQL